MNSKQSAPIGVFDSGVGGLSILSASLAKLPNESYLYVADTAFAPYGDKSDEAIRHRSMQIASYLVDRGAKAIVIACNTATAAAIHECRKAFDLPIIGVEPGLKPAIKVSTSKRVGVLATQYTIDSLKFQRLLSQLKEQAESVTAMGCPGLVELIENPLVTDQELLELLKPYVAKFEADGIDTLALGCTHYGFVEKQISVLFKGTVQIVDTSVSIALEIERRLAEQNLLTTAHSGRVELLTTGCDTALFNALAARLINYQGEVAHLEVSK